jgi:hypothetical protein
MSPMPPFYRRFSVAGDRALVDNEARASKHAFPPSLARKAAR